MLKVLKQMSRKNGGGFNFCLVLASGCHGDAYNKCCLLNASRATVGMRSKLSRSSCQKILDLHLRMRRTANTQESSVIKAGPGELAEAVVSWKGLNPDVLKRLICVHVRQE